MDTLSEQSNRNALGPTTAVINDLVWKLDFPGSICCCWTSEAPERCHATCGRAWLSSSGQHCHLGVWLAAQLQKIADIFSLCPATDGRSGKTQTPTHHIQKQGPFTGLPSNSSDIRSWRFVFAHCCWKS